MAYMELHQEFRDHTKVKRFASAVGCSRAEARSMIVCLWLWAIGEARSGDVTKFTPQEIADACHAEEVSPKMDAVKLKKLLLCTSILDEKDSKILIHNWKKCGVRILEQSKRRTAKSRKLNALGERTVTLPLRDADALLSLFLSNLSTPSIYPSLRTEDFAASLREWAIFRKEKKKPLTEQQGLKQLAWLATQSNPIGCIDQSIRNGWQGLFELKGNNGKTPTRDDINRTVERNTAPINRPSEG